MARSLSRGRGSCLWQSRVKQGANSIWIHCRADFTNGVVPVRIQRWRRSSTLLFIFGFIGDILRDRPITDGFVFFVEDHIGPGRRIYL